MGLQHVMQDQLITGNGAAIVNGPRIHVGGQAVDVHGVGPVVAHMSVQISNDGHNWIAATDADGANITNINATNWYREVRERPEFVRGALAAAAALGAQYVWRFGIHKAA